LAEALEDVDESMVALTIKIMEIINRRRTDSNTRGRQALCAAREKGRLATWRARVGSRPASKAKASSARHLLVTSGGRFISRELLIIRVIFAKQKQKAPESVRTSGIALRRLWALGSYNRPAGLWFQPTKSNSGAGRKQRPRPIRAGPTGHRTSMSTPGRDLLISTPGSRTRRRSSMITSRSRAPLPTVMSRSRWTHSFLPQRPDAVLPADPVRARWQRERGRTRYRDRDSKHMSCSHPLASIVVALVKRDMGKDVPKFPSRTVGYPRWPHRGTA